MPSELQGILAGLVARFADSRRRLADLTGLDWACESTRRRSLARPGPTTDGSEPPVVVADVSIDASQHPYDGDGWRIGIAISRDNRSCLWLDASSHASRPGFLLRSHGPLPTGLRTALQQGFSLTP